MQKIAVFGISAIAALAGGALVAAQIDHDGEAAASGPAGAPSYAVGSFDKVAAAGPHHVIVKVGPANSVRAEGPSASLERMEVFVKDGQLVIRPKKDLIDWSWKREDAPVTYYVTLPRITAAAQAGSGDMSVDQVSGDSFDASVAGSGEMNVASLTVRDAHLSVAGSGKFSASGSTRDASLSIAGSGEIKARQLRSATASVSITGSGDAEVAASDEANVSIVGSGDVEVLGTSNCSVSKMGSGSVSCGGEQQAS